MTAEVKRLYRSRDERMIAGVAGGLGEYFAIDPTIVRLLFALSVFFGFGTGLLVYLILMLVVPEEPLASEAVVEVKAEEKKTPPTPKKKASSAKKEKTT
jgi:phage shock protein C